MKFWKKLVLFVITAISIILSISRFYIVKNNFLNSLENLVKQNSNQNILERYMLENAIVNMIETGEQISNEKIIENLKNMYEHSDNNSEAIAIYSEKYEQIYSNIKDIENLNIESILDEEKEYYCLREVKDNHYMLFSSHWFINNETIYIINAYDINTIYEERDRQLREILITDIVILVISSIVISIFSILLTKPIDSLNKTTKKIASGNFSERVNINSKDEIGELANSFNLMADQVENKINELNLQVKQKNDFINGFTHELKTPMTAIVGYSDLLRLRNTDEETYRKAINYIYSETKRLEKLSFKLMKLMSLSNEKIELEVFEISEFIEKMVKMESIIFNSKIELNLEKAYVKGDKELLEVVIKNLLENSDKSEPKDNKIVIKGERKENKKYRISVIDKGCGIPKEHINRVTEDFYMVDKARSREKSGSGIGLSLVKKILNLHNSEIFIESEENIGTTAYFELEEEEK